MNAGLILKNSKSRDAWIMLFHPKKYAIACNFFKSNLIKSNFYDNESIIYPRVQFWIKISYTDGELL